MLPYYISSAIYKDARTADIIDIAERYGIGWDRAEELIKLREREEFFSEEVIVLYESIDKFQWRNSKDRNA